MSADKISDKTIRFGNLYIYLDFALYFILGFLIVIRSAVQGVCRSGFVLGAGVAELIARTVICAFLPAIINGGAITAEASDGAFIALCFGDPGAWLLASLLLVIPFVKNIIKKNYKENRLE